MLPQEVRAVLGKYIEELDRKLDPTTPAVPPRASFGDHQPTQPAPQVPTGRVAADGPDENDPPGRLGAVPQPDQNPWLR
jgi:hypothetical protein